MRNPQRIAGLALVTGLVLALLAGGIPASAGGGPKWVCPPCGSPHDEEVFDAPGKCPRCGMTLVEKKEILNVAILLFDGVQIIDFAGPYEVFGQGHFNVYTVSESGEPLTTAMSLSVDPTYSFATSPPPDILIVPGGHVHDAQESAATIRWIQESAAHAEHVLSVCNGAFLLAAAGLLDGKTATTFYGLIDDLAAFRPQVDVVRDRRYVDNGKIITSAGLSSGIDASLYLVSKVLGMGRARTMALHLEYQWDPESTFARASLADLLLPRLGDLENIEKTLETTEGTRDEWTVSYRMQGAESGAALLRRIDRAIGENEGWTSVADAAGEKATASRWAFHDREGRSWNAWVTVEPIGETDALRATLTIRRVGALQAARD